MTVRTLVLGLVETNCYILSSTSNPGHALVIDPADHAATILEELNRRSLTLDAILLTHTHFDHMEALDELVNATGAKLFCPKKDEKGLRDYNVNGSMLFFRNPVIVNTKPARQLVEGDEITFGSEKLLVLETPGHTAGSVCYDTGELLFTGDTLFCRGYGRTDLPGGNRDELFSSIHRLFALGDRTVYPGHAGSTTLENERRFFGV